MPNTYQVFASYPATAGTVGPIRYLEDAALGGQVRVLLSGPSFTVRVQISNATFTPNAAPPDSSFETVATVTEPDQPLTFAGPARYIRLVVDSGQVDGGNVSDIRERLASGSSVTDWGGGDHTTLPENSGYYRLLTSAEAGQVWQKIGGTATRRPELEVINPVTLAPQLPTTMLGSLAPLARNGVNDDGPALQALFTSLANGQAGSYTLAPGAYFSAQPLKLPNPSYQHWDMTGVTLVFDRTLTGILLELGDDAAGTVIQNPVIYTPTVTRNVTGQSDIPKRGSGQEVTGLRTTNITRGFVYLVDAQYCTIGFDPHGSTGHGNVYNEYHLAQFRNCVVGVLPTAGTNGWSNENLYFGGRFWNNWTARTASASNIGDSTVALGTHFFVMGDLLTIGGSQGITLAGQEARTVTAVNGNTVTLDSPLTYAHASNTIVAGDRCEAHIIMPIGFSCNQNIFLKPSLEGAAQNGARLLGFANAIRDPRPELWTVGGPCLHRDGEDASSSTYGVETIVVDRAHQGNIVRLMWYGGTVGYLASSVDRNMGADLSDGTGSYRSLRGPKDDPGFKLNDTVERNGAINNDTPMQTHRDLFSSLGTPHGRRYETARAIMTSDSVGVLDTAGAFLYDLYRREHYAGTLVERLGGAASTVQYHMRSPDGITPPTTRRGKEGANAGALAAGDTFIGSDGARLVWNGAAWVTFATNPKLSVNSGRFDFDRPSGAAGRFMGHGFYDNGALSGLAYYDYVSVAWKWLNSLSATTATLTTAGALTLADSLTLGTKLITTPTAVQTLTAATAIIASAAVVQVTAASAITVTAVQTIANGVDGQHLRIVNVGTNAITLQDQGTLTNSNLRLTATQVAIGPRQSIELMYSATVADWVQVTNLVAVL